MSPSTLNRLLAGGPHAKSILLQFYVKVAFQRRRGGHLSKQSGRCGHSASESGGGGRLGCEQGEGKEPQIQLSVCNKRRCTHEVDIYIYMYTYMYTHIYVHVYIHTNIHV